MYARPPFSSQQHNIIVTIAMPLFAYFFLQQFILENQPGQAGFAKPNYQIRFYYDMDMGRNFPVEAQLIKAV